MTMNLPAWRAKLLETYPELSPHLDWVERRMGRCESDLERAFLMLVAAHLQTFSISFAGEGSPYGKPGGDSLIDVAQQVSIAGYRCDFVFTIRWHRGGKARRVAVECDGHRFHDRTKEQASSDRRRDRKLLASGVPTLRYTYSDITADPDGSVRDLYSTLRALASQLSEGEQ